MRRDGFGEWFATATALNEIGQIPMGSRPARRGLSVNSLDDLRAIPWVFAWTQARFILPALALVALAGPWRSTRSSR